MDLGRFLSSLDPILEMCEITRVELAEGSTELYEIGLTIKTVPGMPQLIDGEACHLFAVYVPAAHAVHLSVRGELGTSSDSYSRVLEILNRLNMANFGNLSRFGVMAEEDDGLTLMVSHIVPFPTTITDPDLPGLRAVVRRVIESVFIDLTQTISAFTRQETMTRQ